MSQCCGPEPEDKSECSSSSVTSCEASTPAEVSDCCAPKSRVDYFFWLPLSLIVIFYFAHYVSGIDIEVITQFSHSVHSMMNTMAWGVVAGVVMVAVLSYVPKDIVMGALGCDKGLNGILRATLAGVLLDLCSHGILMVGAKLYERGLSIGQVMAFLIASPWNSFSLTLILIAFIGLKWTLLFIVFSFLIAVISGLIFNALTARGVLPENPNTEAVAEGFSFWLALGEQFKKIKISKASVTEFIATGFVESKMVIRWLFIGVLIAASIQTFVSDAYFAEFFGASMLGLLLTMVAATIIEVCSEGATPIAADLFHRAHAPGNSFAFLMAGVSTDYTEIMVLRERTGSWKLALFLPLVTLPQVFTIAILINSFA